MDLQHFDSQGAVETAESEVNFAFRGVGFAPQTRTRFRDFQHVAVFEFRPAWQATPQVSEASRTRHILLTSAGDV